jgi:hypothetical protein
VFGNEEHGAFGIGYCYEERKDIGFDRNLNLSISNFQSGVREDILWDKRKYLTR